MKTHNKMMIAVGALALTATTLLAGCGGSSTASTAASSPAAESPAPSSAAPESPAPEPAAPEAPASLIDGLVQPAGVSDDVWAAFTESVAGMDVVFDGEMATPEKLSEMSSMDMDTLEEGMLRGEDNEIKC